MRYNIPPRQALLFAFLALVALYALFQGRYIILGPRVHLAAPLDGAVLSSNIVTVSGTAKNVTFISLDDRPIFLDEHGNFSEEVLAPAGQSTIIVKARDRFGRETAEMARIVVNQ